MFFSITLDFVLICYIINSAWPGFWPISVWVILISAAFIPMNRRTSQFQQNPLLNKGTSNIFYKTRLCTKFVFGNCSNGEKCTYAHGVEDRSWVYTWWNHEGFEEREKILLQGIIVLIFICGKHVSLSLLS